MVEVFSIRILRAVAALGVVAFHVQLDLRRNGGLATESLSLAWGSAGVDLFFVISGFIMVYSAEKLFNTPGGSINFAKRRLIRILPLYWFFTIAYVAVAGLSNVPHKSYSTGLIVASFLFIPWLSPDGFVEPVVGQGWTLNYEMLFYAIFACIIVLPRRPGVIVACLAVCCLVAIGYIYQLPLPLGFWLNPLMLEFVFGMILALIYMEGVQLPCWNAPLLIGAGILWILLAFVINGMTIAHRELDFGLGASLIVAGAILCGPPPSWLHWRWLAVIGDASYSLYLSHSIPIRAVRPLFMQSSEIAPLWMIVATDLVLAVVFAVVVHFYFEKPTTHILKSWLLASRSPVGWKTGDLIATPPVSQ